MAKDLTNQSLEDRCYPKTCQSCKIEVLSAVGRLLGLCQMCRRGIMDPKAQLYGQRNTQANLPKYSFTGSNVGRKPK